MTQKQAHFVSGTLFTSDSGNDPAYYFKKQEVERRLGRELTTAEFQELYYTGPDTYTSGTSIFDPVLCELVYTWFSSPGAAVLDPFAGGSVRGIVAAYLGRKYTGIDLRQEQIDANVAQAVDIFAEGVRRAVTPPDHMPELTPVEQRGELFFKREDDFCIGGGRGGKVRTCWALAQGAAGLVTAGSRSSPQVNIVAQIARKLNIPCRVHTPTGELSPEVQMAKDSGAEVVQHKAGYNNVIIARAREDAEAMGWREIPFGMECEEAVIATAAQVENLPNNIKRIVIPVGSGMSLAGVLHGMQRFGVSVPVLGVTVGADPTPRLDKYAPADWREMVTLIDPGIDYHAPAKTQEVAGIKLDFIYEAKCIPYLQPGDLMWIVGLRATESLGYEQASVNIPRWIAGDSTEMDDLLPEGEQYDLIFSCPPYADLEVYSDDPRDISTMDYPDFLRVYRDIIARSVARLRDDRFACFVVGEVRGKDGNYYNFVGDTVQAFIDAGCAYYNEAILVTAVGSLPIRAGKQFAAGRKLGKTHQNVLVFVKGDARRAADWCGEVDVMDIFELGSEALEDEA